LIHAAHNGVAQESSKEVAMTAIVSAKPTALAAAAIGLGALMIVVAPSAHASEKSDCEGKGGTYTETQVTWNGKTGTTYRCCVKDAQTNTTSCTSTTVTKASRVPLTVRPDVIGAAEPVEPTAPVQRVPLDVVNTEAQIQQAH
jgi:hypothetical protein